VEVQIVILWTLWTLEVQIVIPLDTVEVQIAIPLYTGGGKDLYTFVHRWR